MNDKLKIRETIIKDTEIILWKNFNKNPENNNYNITIALKGVVYLTVSTINKKDLNAISSKYDSVISWLNYMVGVEEDV